MNFCRLFRMFFGSHLSCYSLRKNLGSIHSFLLFTFFTLSIQNNFFCFLFFSSYWCCVLCNWFKRTLMSIMEPFIFILFDCCFSSFLFLYYPITNFLRYVTHYECFYFCIDSHLNPTPCYQFAVDNSCSSYSMMIFWFILDIYKWETLEIFFPFISFIALKMIRQTL